MLRAFAVFLGTSLLYFGVPILAHPLRDLVGSGPDPEIFVWALGWWPHAVLHGQNPVVTHVLWAPVGVNLAWTISVPTFAFLFSPLTLALGPVLSYNVLAILAPALDAFACFLLCRHLTRRFWPSLAGGYLFGFSSYVFGQAEGHLHATAVFLVPLIALAVVCRVEGSLSRRRFALLLGVMLALQFGISTEVFFTASLALGVSLVAAFALLPAVRLRAPALAVELVCAYALGLVLVSPLLFYALLHFQHGSFNPPAAYPADLLNVIVPTRLTWLHTGWTLRESARFQGNEAENGAYLGLPVVGIVAWYAWDGRRRATAWLAVVLTLLAVFVELGTALHVGGRRVLPLPWSHLVSLPAFDNVLPVRLSMYAALGASVIVALWASQSGVSRVLRAALVVVAIAFVVPHVWLDVWHEHPFRPAFFADGLYRACLGPNDNLLVLPYPGHDDAMLWQAEAGYRFRMADGNVSPLAPKGIPNPVFVQDLISGYRPPKATGILRVARDQHVTAILVPGNRDDWLGPFTKLPPPTSIGDVYLFAVGPKGTSACTS